MTTTTQRVYKIDIPTAERWIDKMGFHSFAELFHAIVVHVDNHKKAELYNRLTPIIIQPPKKLSGCKIDKSKICIQK